MTRIISIDILGHHDSLSVKNRAVGAAEYQHYFLLSHLKSYCEELICFNNKKTQETIDGICYLPKAELNNFQFDPDDRILIQRKIPQEDILDKIRFQKKIYWTHGLINKCPEFFKYDLEIVFVSEFARNFFQSEKIDRTHVIFNILYEEEFESIEQQEVELNSLVYASAWHKGIDKIIDIFKYILNQNQNMKLYLMHPGYGLKSVDQNVSKIKSEFGKSVEIAGALSKKEYGKLIKKSLCVLCPKFLETFGCVCAESLYLGTPVLFPEGAGAVDEIVDHEWRVDYSDKKSVYDKICYLQKIRKSSKFFLKDKFMLEPNIKNWIRVLGL